MRNLAKRVAITVLLAVGSSPAIADAIDGDWCSDDGSRHFSIAGPGITTPEGTQATGSYSRHAFSYVVPTGEPGAGDEIHMQLLNEQQVRVFVNGEAPEIWHRCQLTA